MVPAMKDVSIVIPVWKEPYLEKMVNSILETFVTDYEIIPVFDGCENTLEDHDRIKPVVLKENVGMRGAINAGVAAAEGKYLMRGDGHIMFGNLFDKTIIENMEDNWIVDAKRYFLDPVKWKVMPDKPIVMERLIVSKRHNKFAALPWREMDNKVPIKPKQAFQGSFWCMSHDWWDTTIGELQEEGYGKLYQDSTEMSMKTWKAGGEVMSNQMTWYAHKHRSFNRTHSYPNHLSRACWDYALDTWGDFYQNELQEKWKQQYST